MGNLRKHFEEKAQEFDEIIQRLIPYYNQMLDAIVSSIPFEKSRSIKVVDLGCGTGTISLLTKKLFPHANITCLDIAKNMIEIAKTKLKNYSNIEYIISDFEDFSFGQSYDVVVSSLALHHLVTDKDKIRFYRKIYNCLSVGGIFINADVILGSNLFLENAFISKWKEFMLKRVTSDEIENKWIPKYKDEDHPAILLDQLNWLKEIGFKEVDVIWKYYNFAVYGGYRI